MNLQPTLTGPTLQLAPLRGGDRERLDAPRGVLVRDRASALKFWAMENRQVGWAHLQRKFVASMHASSTAGATAALTRASMALTAPNDTSTPRTSRSNWTVLLPLK
jgi:hypothetical protein